MNRSIPLTLVSRPLTNSLWRVKAGLHTIAQVSVGAVVGASDAALWYWFCKAYFTTQVERVAHFSNGNGNDYSHRGMPKRTQRSLSSFK